MPRRTFEPINEKREIFISVIVTVGFLLILISASVAGVLLLGPMAPGPADTGLNRAVSIDRPM
jgi:hypothetical protein